MGKGGEAALSQKEITGCLVCDPKLSVAQFVKYIKGSSSHYINQTFLNQTFAWQREYGVFSLGEKQLSDAIAYVQNKKHHHHTQTLIHSLEPDILTTPPKPL